MTGKKSKGSSNKAKAANQPRPSGPSVERLATKPQLHHPTALERAERAQPCWQALSPNERLELLTADVSLLYKTARQLHTGPDGPSSSQLVTALERTIERLKQYGTAKVWEWRGVTSGLEPSKCFHSVDSFLKFIQTEHLPDNLARLLSGVDAAGKHEERAETMFRKRMLALLQPLQRLLEDFKRVKSRHGAATDPTMPRNGGFIEAIHFLLEGMKHEHEFLYDSLLQPVTALVCAMVPDEMRGTTLTDLYLEDLERMPLENVGAIFFWLVAKIEVLATQLKPERGQVDKGRLLTDLAVLDLLELASDGESLRINAKWLQLMGERVVNYDGSARIADEREAAGSSPGINAVLAWVYQSAVSKVQKVLEAARKPLGAHVPSMSQAYETVLAALREQQRWESRAQEARDVLRDLLRSRQDAAELAQQYGIGSYFDSEAPIVMHDASVPDRVALFMLRREVVLTRAELFVLRCDHAMGERELRRSEARLRQDELMAKPSKRKTQSTFHKHLEVRIREELQRCRDRHRGVVGQQLNRDAKIKLLTGWQGTGEHLVGMVEERLGPSAAHSSDSQISQELTSTSAPAQVTPVRRPSRSELKAGLQQEIAVVLDGLDAQFAASGGSSGDPETHLTPLLLFKLDLCKRMCGGEESRALAARLLAQSEERKRLCSDALDKLLFSCVQAKLKDIEVWLEEGRVALNHLLAQMANLACDDPATQLCQELLQPLFAQRLDSMVEKQLSSKIEAAQAALLAQEQAEAAKRSSKKERRKVAKQLSLQDDGLNAEDGAKAGSDSPQELASKSSVDLAAETVHSPPHIPSGIDVGEMGDEPADLSISSGQSTPLASCRQSMGSGAIAQLTADSQAGSEQGGELFKYPELDELVSVSRLMSRMEPMDTGYSAQASQQQAPMLLRQQDQDDERGCGAPAMQQPAATAADQQDAKGEGSVSQESSTLAASDGVGGSSSDAVGASSSGAGTSGVWVGAAAMPSLSQQDEPLPEWWSAEVRPSGSCDFSEFAPSDDQMSPAADDKEAVQSRPLPVVDSVQEVHMACSPAGADTAAGAELLAADASVLLADKPLLLSCSEETGDLMRGNVSQPISNVSCSVPLEQWNAPGAPAIAPITPTGNTSATAPPPSACTPGAVAATADVAALPDDAQQQHGMTSHASAASSLSTAATSGPISPTVPSGRSSSAPASPAMVRGPGTGSSSSLSAGSDRASAPDSSSSTAAVAKLIVDAASAAMAQHMTDAETADVAQRIADAVAAAVAQRFSNRASTPPAIVHPPASSSCTPQATAGEPSSADRPISLDIPATPFLAMPLGLLTPDASNAWQPSSTSIPLQRSPDVHCDLAPVGPEPPVEPQPGPTGVRQSHDAYDFSTQHEPGLTAVTSAPPILGQQLSTTAPRPAPPLLPLEHVHSAGSGRFTGALSMLMALRDGQGGPIPPQGSLTATTPPPLSSHAAGPSVQPNAWAQTVGQASGLRSVQSAREQATRHGAALSTQQLGTDDAVEAPVQRWGPIGPPSARSGHRRPQQEETAVMPPLQQRQPTAYAEPRSTQQAPLLQQYRGAQHAQQAGTSAVGLTQQQSAPAVVLGWPRSGGPRPRAAGPLPGKQGLAGARPHTVEDDDPQELCCPITQELMRDPVMAMDTHTYERSAIEEWLVKKKTSPMTGLPLPSFMLLPNTALRSIIDDYRQKKLVSKKLQPQLQQKF